MRALFSKIGQYFPVVVIGGGFIWAGISIASFRAKIYEPGTIVLRMGHWQLESGVRDGFDELAREYEKLHPKVRIVQQAIPESTYKQWLSTQMMGGTAPDIVQAGQLPENLLLAFYARYMLPMTPYANQPNPYNKGTELDGVPLRQTIKDGMRLCYVEELQEYMSIPLSQIAVRVFYNKTLLKKLTGLETPPQDYRAFLTACDQIAAQTNAAGKRYTPIAGSAYHFKMWESRLFLPITYAAMKYADLSRDGKVGKDEFFLAISSGQIDFHFPAYKAMLGMVRDITNHFQSGFTGLTRDEAVFLFAQQQAVFISVGTYDARSLVDQASDDFEVGLMDFPTPSKDDPIYGDFVYGPNYEELDTAFRFAVTRSSPHYEEALDFLLFLASKKQNEKLNEIIGWIPAVKGTGVIPLLKGFEPRLEGVTSAIVPSLGGETIIKWEQLYSLYQVGQISYEDFVEQFEDYYKERGLRDYQEIARDKRRKVLRDEQLLSGIRAKALFSTTPEDESGWVKYRTLMASRQLRADITFERDQQRLRDPAAFPRAPYEYSPEALSRISERAKATAPSAQNLN